MKKLHSRGLFLLLFVLSFSLFTLSAQRASVAFWNVENLYDTIPSPFYDDTEWTPWGANRWNTERYRAKIGSLARVLDELGADIVGLAEVENESVVRDLVQTLETGYNYIHMTSGDSRGIDLALLYKGDKFFPAADSARLIPSGMGREFLSVRGELLGQSVEFIVCHLASKLNPAPLRRRNMEALRTALESALQKDPAANLIVMGDMNSTPDERMVRRTLGPLRSPWDFVHSPYLPLLDGRQGSYSYRGRWYLYDWMIVSPSIARGSAIRIDGAGVHAREYMTEPDPSGTGAARRPLRTFYGGDWLGGASDHFPVWLTVVK